MEGPRRSGLDSNSQYQFSSGGRLRAEGRTCEFCDALQIERPIVMGSSFGGFVAMAYATRYPDHPGKLILNSTKARRSFRRMLAACERLGGMEAVRALQEMARNTTPETLDEFVRVCGPLGHRNRPGDIASTASRERPGATFDIIVGGWPRGADLNLERKIRRTCKLAGATWWQEWVTGDPEQVREIIRSGPLRSD